MNTLSLRPLRLAVLLAVLSCWVAVPAAHAEYGSVNVFGSPGSGDGALAAPKRVAVEQSTGNVFVVDQASARVLVYSTSGDSVSYLTQISAGLSRPFGIAVSETGGQTAVYVSDGGNDRIVKLDSDEAATPSFTVDGGFTSPTPGSGPGQLTTFSVPLAVAPDGDLWVGDRGPDNDTGQFFAGPGVVKRFSPTGAHVGTDIDGSTSPGGAFVYLLDLAATPAGGVVVISSATSPNFDAIDFGVSTRVERFDAAGGYLNAYHPVTTGNPENAGVVAVDPTAGTVFTASNFLAFKHGTPRYISVFGADGTLSDRGEYPYESQAGIQESGGTVQGLAVSAGTGRLYSTARHQYAPEDAYIIRRLQVPVAALNPVSSITATSAVVTGQVNPSGLQTTFHAEYRRKGIGAPWTPLGDHDVGSGTTPVDVTDTLTGLTPGRGYEVRIVAANSDRTRSSEVGSFAAAREAPLAGTLPVSELDATHARLRGAVDPRGAATTYFFEYGPTEGYGTRVPVTPLSVDAGGLTQVSQLVSGLVPGSTYHFRVVAENAMGTTYGADATFVTLLSARSLRHIEKVSPSDKQANDVYVEFFSVPNYTVHAAADGSAVGYQALGAFGESDSSNTLVDYVARRGSGAWATTGLAPRGFGQSSASVGIAGWSDDLARAAVFGQGRSLAAGEVPVGPNFFNLYQLDAVAQTFRAATVDAGAPGVTTGSRLVYVGGSADLSTMVYEDDVPHTAGATPGVLIPYVWRDGQVKPVAILPDPDGDGPATAPIAPPGTGVGAGPGLSANRERAVSRDGSRIFFTTPDGRIYVRKDGTATVEVSASQKTVADAQQPATYQTASLDGSKVFFITSEQLLDSDTDAVADVYRFDVNTGKLLRISAGAADTTLGVFRMSGVSDDGSYVYFTTVFGGYGDLPASAGPFELWVWHDGTIRYVGDDGDGQANLTQNTVRVSADGTGIVFNSTAPQPAAGGYNSQGNSEVYVFDVARGLQCASCRTDDQPPTGPAEVPVGPTAAGSNSLTVVGKQRTISADGDTVFFTSPDPLVAADTNGKKDAYEYADGQARLLTTGKDPSDSYFLDASRDGSAAFFSTRARLVPEDGDDNVDLYVARTGATFPGTAPQTACDGEGCKGTPARDAPGPAPASSRGGRGDEPVVARPLVRLRSLTAKARAAFARTGKATVSVTVSGPGTVSLTAIAKLGQRTATIAKASAVARGARTVKVTVRLSSAARKELARKRKLKVTLACRFTGVRQAQTSVFTLVKNGR